MTVERDLARFPWHEVMKIQHYRLEVDAMTGGRGARETHPAFHH
jgi:hypothetical protein